MDLKMSLLSSSFVIIHIIHKMLVLLKNHLNHLKNNVSECFFKKYNRLFFLNFCFFIISKDEKSNT